MRMRRMKLRMKITMMTMPMEIKAFLDSQTRKKMNSTRIIIMKDK